MAHARKDVAVPQSDRRKVPGLCPAKRERRGVKGEAEQRGAQADGGEEAATEHRVQQRVERPHRVAEQGQQQVNAGIHASLLSNLAPSGAVLEVASPLRAIRADQPLAPGPPREHGRLEARNPGPMRPSPDP